MLQGYSSVVQALLGTFFTWAMTAAGAALVFIFSSGQVSRFASGDWQGPFGDLWNLPLATQHRRAAATQAGGGMLILPNFLVFSLFPY